MLACIVSWLCGSMRNSCGGGEEEEEEEEEEENDDDMEDEGAGVAETNAKTERKRKYGSRRGMVIKARRGCVLRSRPSLLLTVLLHVLHKCLFCEPGSQRKSSKTASITSRNLVSPSAHCKKRYFFPAKAITPCRSHKILLPSLTHHCTLFKGWEKRSQRLFFISVLPLFSQRSSPPPTPSAAVSSSSHGDSKINIWPPSLPLSSSFVAAAQDIKLLLSPKGTEKDEEGTTAPVLCLSLGRFQSVVF